MAALEIEGPLSVIALAVTPAVMISATAILIGGIATKHGAMADRLRTLMAEYRLPETSVERRKSIELQCGLFQTRLRMITRAHLLLYVATGFFIAMVLAIGVSTSVPVTRAILYPLFLAGTVALGSGVALELMELRMADRTLRVDVAEALHTHSTSR